MIRSMTAFAAGERAARAGGTLSCELRAVNHRFLELSVRLPEELRAIEPALRERVAAKLSRGKVELGMRYRAAAGTGELRVNERLLAQLAMVRKNFGGLFPEMTVDLTELLRFPGVLDDGGVDLPTLHADAL